MARKKGGGGKLSRSEILQARIDSKLRLAVEILARSQRRTVSSLIESLIDQASEREKIPTVLSHNAQINVHLFGKVKTQKLSVKELINRIWAMEEADRFASLALFLPDLLTPEESHVWQIIVDHPYFWKHFKINVESRSGKIIEKEHWPLVNHHGLIHEHLRQHWPLIKSILEGKQKPEKLKQLDLPVGQTIKRPQDYPHEIKKVNTYHD